MSFSTDDIEAPSTYDRYKMGTDQVVAWLVETAARHGFNKFRVPSGSHPQKPRYQEKVSHQGKGLNGNNAINNDVDVTEKHGHKYVLPMGQLPALASLISKCLQRSDLSDITATLDLIRKVIAQRQEWAAKIKSLKYREMTADSRHQRFVVVLEHVYQILDGCRIT